MRIVIESTCEFHTDQFMVTGISGLEIHLPIMLRDFNGSNGRHYGFAAVKTFISICNGMDDRIHGEQGRHLGGV